MGIFNLLFDNETRQRIDLDHATEDLRWVDQYQQELATQLQQLRSVVGEQMTQLRAALIATSEMLVERGLADEAELERRYRQAHERLTQAPAGGARTAASAAPYRDDAAPPAPEPEMTCTACGRSVPRARTNMTGDGVVCDGCFHP